MDLDCMMTVVTTMAMMMMIMHDGMGNGYDL